jgi:hypothetical protein
MNTELLKTTIKNAVKAELDEDTKRTIRKIQADLIRIDNGERFFFNIANYEKLGLIKERDVFGTDSSGNKTRIRTDYYLTDKAKQYVKIAV